MVACECFLEYCTGTKYNTYKVGKTCNRMVQRSEQLKERVCAEGYPGYTEATGSAVVTMEGQMLLVRLLLT